jgi:acetylornithine deacetylase/succinyl-diaminopimelate desuccinylase-like protein
MLADNPLPKAGAVLERLGAFAGRRLLQPETRGFLEAVLGPVDGDADAALARLAGLSQAGARMLEPMLAATVAPTQITSSPARNVIPRACQVTCDCRVLPGQDRAEVEREVRAALGALEYELDWGECTGGSRSALGTPLWDAIAAFVAGIEPAAAVAPILLAGFTDSHYLRESFGTIAYGFFPMRAMDPQLVSSLIHSADERIHVADLELGTRFMVHVARELLS